MTRVSTGVGKMISATFKLEKPLEPLCGANPISCKETL